MDNIFTRFLLKVKFLMVVLFIGVTYQAHAQCSSPVVGCPGTDFTNFGLNSNNDAATIEYDNFSSSFHSTAVRTADGSFQVWGEDLRNGGGNLLSPTTINSTNFPGLTGTVLKVGIASNYVNQVQGVVLTTNGLFAWGVQGNVVSSSLTSSVSLQPLTVDGNTQGLPAGITPAMIKMMFVTVKTIALTTCGGDVYVLSQNTNINQGGSATQWTRIRTNEPGEPFLTNVNVTRGANGTMFALRADGTLWTWGQNTYLGNSTAAADRNRATWMQSPVASGVNVKMIGATFAGEFPNGSPSYYVLDTEGNLYALGLNAQRQLGDFTNTDSEIWIRPRYTSNTGPFMDDIAWISPLEHDWWNYGAINVITEGGVLYAWGANNNRMLGRGSGETVNPGIPEGPLTNDVLAVETGGHTSMIAMKCTENFGYVGHRIRGSMGNGSNSTSTENQFTFATASVQICGAETIPAVFTVTVNSNSDGTICVDGEVRLVPDVSGGTFTLLSGPAVITPDGDDAVLTFTGVGTVEIDYEVVGDCGSVTVEVVLEVVDCVADLEVIKTVNNSTSDVGDPVVFTIQAINNGPQRAANVELTELLPSGYTYVSHTATVGTYNMGTGLWNGFNIVDGESETLQITVTVNGLGNYLNTATITSDTTDPNPTNNEDSIGVTPHIAELNLYKDGSYVDANGDGVTNVGDTIEYVFTVENTGNVTLTNITVTDANAVVSGGPLASLAVGATDTTTFTAVHTLTQDDIDAGYVYNLATATGEDSDGDPVTDESEDPTPCATCPVDPACTDCTIVELQNAPSILITKDGRYVDTNNDGVTNVGDEIAYVFTVENTGNVIIANITVTDANAVVSGGPLASLAVGATDTTTFTAVHVITQDDIDAGYVYNLATATGENTDGDPVRDDSEDPTPCATCPVDPACTDCTIVELESIPSILITKDGSYVDANGDGITNVGDEIAYTFTVENTGNVMLTNITVTDANAVVNGGSLASLAVDTIDTTTFTAIHTITQDDIDAGYVYNLAMATGEDPNGDLITDESEDPTPCATCPVDTACTDCTITELMANLACEIEIYNAVSADGDGVNDIFLLEGIDCYPNNKVMIFNRWGVKVFETEGYDNVTRVFRGYSDGRITVTRGDQLPTGSYFYILEYEYTGESNPRQIKQSGYLYLTTGNQ